MTTTTLRLGTLRRGQVDPIHILSPNLRSRRSCTDDIFDDSRNIVWTSRAREAPDDPVDVSIMLVCGTVQFEQSARVVLLEHLSQAGHK